MSMANPPPWQLVPFHFWSVALFLLGSIVGSFLNVCIHRMPRGESVVTPPSHCPHCRYSIPWYLNIPLVTWPMLGGKCKNCAAPISIRYFLVELLTAVLFLSCWLAVGQRSPPLALVYCLLLAGFIVATFIDVEHFIIPDEITLGGVAAGVGCSFLVPALHGVPTAALSLERCFAGAIAGAALVYGILRLGKLLYGRQKFELAPGSKVFFTETTVKLPDKEILYEDIFYRKSDAIVLEARTVEMVDRAEDAERPLRQGFRTGSRDGQARAAGQERRAGALHGPAGPVPAGGERQRAGAGHGAAGQVEVGNREGRIEHHRPPGKAYAAAAAEHERRRRIERLRASGERQPGAGRDREGAGVRRGVRTAVDH